MSYSYIGKSRPEEYEEYIDLMNYVFGLNGVDNTFRTRIPKLFKEEYHPWENSYVIKESERLRAVLGLFEGTLHVLETGLKTFGIGGVAVHPNSRSKGYMSELMKLAAEQIKNSGADLAFLGGKRQRYSYFGYERCGQAICYDVTPINIKHKFGSEKRSTLSLKKLSADDKDALSGILHLLNSQPCYYERSPDALYDILCSWKAVPYAAYDGEKFAGYFVVTADKKEIIEFGTVSDEYVYELIIKIFEEINTDTLSFSFPPFDTKHVELFSDIAEKCSIYHVCSFSVLCYRNVIEALLKLKASYQPLCSGSAVLLIHGIAGDEKIEITVQNQKVTVEHTDKPHEIELTHLEAMNFLFANICPARLNAYVVLASWLPLPIYLYRNDNV